MASNGISNSPNKIAISKLIDKILSADWRNAEKLLKNLPRPFPVTQYALFLVRRTSFLESIRQATPSTPKTVLKGLEFLSKMTEMVSPFIPSPWLDCDTVNPKFYTSYENSKCTQKRHFSFKVPEETTQILIDKKLAERKTKQSNLFIQNSPAEFGAINLFEEFEEVLEEISYEWEENVTKLAEAEFLLKRAVSDDLQILSAVTVMKENQFNYNEMLPNCRFELGVKLVEVLCKTDSKGIYEKRSKLNILPRYNFIWSSLSQNYQIWDTEFSPDGEFLIVSANNGELVLYSAEISNTAEIIATPALEMSSKKIKKIIEIAAEESRAFRSQKTPTKELNELFRVSGMAKVTSIVWSPDSKRFITCSQIGFEVWHQNGKKIIKEYSEKEHAVEDASWFPDSKTFLTANSRGLFLYEISTKKSLIFLNLRHLKGVKISYPFNAFKPQKTPKNALKIPNENNRSICSECIDSLNTLNISPESNGSNEQKKCLNDIIQSLLNSSPGRTAEKTARYNIENKLIQNGRNKIDINRPKAIRKAKIIVSDNSGRFYVSFHPFLRFFLFVDFGSPTHSFDLSRDDILTVHCDEQIHRWDVSKVSPSFLSAVYAFDKTVSPLKLIYGDRTDRVEEFDEVLCVQGDERMVRSAEDRSEQLRSLNSFGRGQGGSEFLGRAALYFTKESGPEGLFSRSKSDLPFLPSFQNLPIEIFTPHIEWILKAILNAKDCDVNVVTTERTALLMKWFPRWGELLSAEGVEKLRGRYGVRGDGLMRESRQTVSGMKLVRRLVGSHQRRMEVKSCGVVSDGIGLVLSGSEDGVVYGWTDDESPVLAIEGHCGIVNSVCCKRDGNGVLVVSGGDDGTVKLWMINL